MPQPRSQQISLSDTPYYHCSSRCVRQTFLCGVDELTGRSYEHRRGWVEKRVQVLAQAFCIDACAYAVMGNHAHVVLHVNPGQAKSLSDREVITRWHEVFRGSPLARQYLQTSEDDVEPWVQVQIAQEATIYRKRLYDISWFMSSLNEYIARRANAEDGCTGRFWEGRFKSHALLGEAAIASCMAYVDLNPIRARLASTPETSAHTSIRQRIIAMMHGKEPESLMPFSESAAEYSLPFAFADYLALVETTGRVMRHDKPGKIDSSLPSLLDRLGLNYDQWFTLTTRLESLFSVAIGSEGRLKSYCEHTNRHHIKGISASRKWLNTG